MRVIFYRYVILLLSDHMLSTCVGIITYQAKTTTTIALYCCCSLHDLILSFQFDLHMNALCTIGSSCNSAAVRFLLEISTSPLTYQLNILYKSNNFQYLFSVVCVVLFFRCSFVVNIEHSRINSCYPQTCQRSCSN